MSVGDFLVYEGYLRSRGEMLIQQGSKIQSLDFVAGADNYHILLSSF